MDNNKIEDLVQQHSSRLLEILAKLVTFKTVSPPARNTREIQNYIRSELVNKGFNVRQTSFYEDDELVSATKVGTDSARFNSLMLNGHVDVAAIGNVDNWHTDPFTLVQDGDILLGRGVSDMKGSFACFLYVAELLDQSGINLPGDLKIQLVVGEEAGEAGTKTLLSKGDKADFAIVGDTSDLNFQGQGGVITGWITLKSSETYHDGNRVKMVSTGGGLVAANMIEKMMIIIDVLNKLERYWGITKSYPGFPAGTDTINPAYIEGGIHPAFVPNECRLWITAHFYPDESIESITAEIEAAVKLACQADPWLRDNLPTFSWGGDSMLVNKGEVFPPLSINENHLAMRRLKECHRSVFANEPGVEMSTSVSDSGWFEYYGIPAIDYGPGKILEAHSDNEQVSLKQLLGYSQVLMQFIFTWCSSKKQ